jgi:hypothetical protein
MAGRIGSSHVAYIIDWIYLVGFEGAGSFFLRQSILNTNEI